MRSRISSAHSGGQLTVEPFSIESEGLAVFDTPIGRCAIAWTDRGVCGVQLPDGTEAQTRTLLARRFPQLGEAIPSGPVLAAIDTVLALLSGKDANLGSVLLDLTGVPTFHRQVYEALRVTSRGTTLTYGELAARAGSPGAARAVGTALKRNPLAVLVPCHRVVAAGGRLGGFSAGRGLSTKTKILAAEGVRFPAEAVTADRIDGFDFDPPTAVRHLIRADPMLARIVDRVGPFGMELGTTPSIFVALAESIMYQQLSGQAAATIYGRMCALFRRPEAGPTAEELLALSDEQLRAVGVSRPKILSLRDLAVRQLSGEIPTLTEARMLGDEDLVQLLIPVRGIGRWTVQMLLMFRLGRPDVLPADDLGIRKGFARVFGVELPEPAEVMERGVRWSPYRTVASWYLWRAAEFDRVEAGT